MVERLVVRWIEGITRSEEVWRIADEVEDFSTFDQELHLVACVLNTMRTPENAEGLIPLIL